MYDYIGRFVAYPSEHARIGHVLWIAHTHLMERWDSTPRIAFLSPEPGSGKSRALEVSAPLVPNPVHAVNTSPAYLFRKVGVEDGKPTILFDEIDTVFGPRAKENEEIRGLLNAGHRKGAVAGDASGMAGGAHRGNPGLCGRCAGRTRWPARHDPVAIRRHQDATTRAKRESRTVPAATSRTRGKGHWRRPCRMVLDGGRTDRVAGHSPVQDRDADLWKHCSAVADAAGGDWPQRARRQAALLFRNRRRVRRVSASCC
ncbi:MAG: DUF3631 domain-containing protein [Lysobacterales bacterium]